MAENKKEIIERLIEVRMDTGMLSKDFAMKAGIDPKNYSSIESGKRPIGDRVMNDICRAFNINAVWLKTGERRKTRRPRIVRRYARRQYFHAARSFRPNYEANGNGIIPAADDRKVGGTPKRGCGCCKGCCTKGGTRIMVLKRNEYTLNEPTGKAACLSK